MTEIGYIPTYFLFKKYGFTEYQIRTVLAGYDHNQPEYAWVKETLLFAGSKKPRVHLEMFIERYAEFQHAQVDREIQRIRDKIEKVETE